MKITMTVREIMDKGLWLEVCQMKGISEWAVNEGRMNSNEEIILSENEAQRLRLIG